MKKNKIVSLIIAAMFIFEINSLSAKGEELKIKRFAGNNRYETSAQISQSGWKNGSNYVVIVSGEDFPDALCAAPLAKKYNAPILLAKKDSIPSEIKTEILRLNAKNAIIVGGKGVVSDDVEKTLKSSGIEQVKRVAGNDRFETSVEVAKELGKTAKAVITTGYDYSDALSIASIAANLNMPILLTETNNISQLVKDFALKNSFQQIFIIGGVGAVDTKIESTFANAKRIGGSDRFDTNDKIIGEFKSELNFDNLVLTTGYDFPDALSGAAFATIGKSPMVLVSSDYTLKEDSNLKKLITKDSKLNVLGGLAVVKDDVINNINKYLMSIQVPIIDNTKNNTNIINPIIIPISQDKIAKVVSAYINLDNGSTIRFQPNADNTVWTGSGASLKDSDILRNMAVKISKDAVINIKGTEVKALAGSEVIFGLSSIGMDDNKPVTAGKLRGFSDENGIVSIDGSLDGASITFKLKIEK